MNSGVLLSDHTTLRVGGPAREYFVATSERELIEAVRECDDSGAAVLVLGGGSNLVVRDAGFPGTVVEVTTSGFTVTSHDDRVELTVAAGEPWDAVVDLAVANGWSGIEALSGIPGRCGATPIQNVGAYGQEIADVLVAVECLDRMTGELVTLDAASCSFGYRTSAFKQFPDRWLVLSVSLEMERSITGTVQYAELARAMGVDIGDRAAIADIRAAVLELRRAKGMVLDALDHDTWSAGSFFTNPVLATTGPLPAGCPTYPAQAGIKLSAAWLIEHAGIDRGFALDSPARAAISGKHTLAITNRGSASASDVVRLASAVQGRVAAQFGIDLAVEPTVLVSRP